ncbi:MAG: peptide-methionine (S)-S-oxide reductase MsrA [Cellulosilyticaceae bacterium]
MKKIVFAGGCFWGVEEYMSRIEGVVYTEVGYANGNTQNPTYDEVCTNTTGFVEACYVEYDINTISLECLLAKFWSVINPTVLNKQGEDTGTQYRTGIYYLDEEELPTIMQSMEEEQKRYNEPIVTEVLPLNSYYMAEVHHQKYLKNNPNGYCHISL